MHYPKISIVTTSFNHAAFLEDTILSIHNQNYPNIEHIIIDGGSKDNTVEIIEKYNDKIAYWVSEPDKGHADALYKGLNKATGEIINWICSDDLLLPNSLFFMAEYFEKHKNVDWVAGNGLIIDKHKKILEKYYAVKMSKPLMLTFEFSTIQPSIFYRHEFLKKVGGVKQHMNLSPDFDLFVRCSLQQTSGLINKFIGVSTIHNDAQSVRMNEKIREINDALKMSYGADKINPLKRKLLYKFYQNKVIYYARFRKLLAILLPQMRDYKKGEELVINNPFVKK